MHQTAEEFVTLDNYYADGETSVLGHSYILRRPEFTVPCDQRPAWQWSDHYGHCAKSDG